MLTIGQYVRPQSLDEAYTLCQKKNNVVLGGMLWLKMQHRTVGTAIDLCDLGLDKIEETENEYRIGAMVSLRALETHEGLAALTGGAMAEAVRHIVGVQFRNCATLGGSLWGRFGFSDVLTLFLALGARVTLHHAGEMPLADFAALPRTTRDILTQITVSKAPRRVVYLSQRNISTDFPVLTCALGERDGAYICVIGARPMPAVVFADEKGLLAQGITEDSARAFAEDVAARAAMGGNMRASADYRREICKVLVRRAAMALSKEG
ncbi:MAG: FAD binding domain-containing protein [Clostridiaceae bacterium]|nr:FAD binding domain-containing protein [Clostridiaceae bacterium]